MVKNIKKFMPYGVIRTGWVKIVYLVIDDPTSFFFKLIYSELPKLLSFIISSFLSNQENGRVLGSQWLKMTVSMKRKVLNQSNDFPWNSQKRDILETAKNRLKSYIVSIICRSSIICSGGFL